MSSSEAYLGAFESNDQIQVRVSRESLEMEMSYMEENDITINDKVWKEIYDAIYESDLVADFIEGANAIASDIIEKNKKSIKNQSKKGQ